MCVCILDVVVPFPSISEFAAAPEVEGSLAVGVASETEVGVALETEVGVASETEVGVAFVTGFPVEGVALEAELGPVGIERERERYFACDRDFYVKLSTHSLPLSSNIPGDEVRVAWQQTRGWREYSPHSPLSQENKTHDTIG